MGKRIYLSFHIAEDYWRARQVRNAWTTKDHHETAGYVEPEQFQELRQTGTDQIRQWVHEELRGCDVTAVLVGEKTKGHALVNYEIKRSVAAGKGIVGIRVHNIEDKDGHTTPRGPDPLGELTTNGTPLNELFNTYDWKLENGPLHLDSWVEEAIETARKAKSE